MGWDGVFGGVGGVPRRASHPTPLPLSLLLASPSYGFLYVGLSYVYWDTIDALRKLGLAAIPVFVAPQPSGSLQALAASLLVVASALAVLAVRPFTAPEENWLTVASNVALWLLLLSGGALKWARLTDRAQAAVAIAQVALSFGLGAVVVAVIVWRTWRLVMGLPGMVVAGVRSLARCARGGRGGGAAASPRRLNRKPPRGGAGGKVTPAEFVDAVEVKEGVGASGSGRTRAATPPPSSASAGLIRAAGAGGSGAPLLSPPATGRATLDAEGGDGVV